MKEKRRAYIGQDVYIGRPGRLPDVECCHLVFVWLYIIPTLHITSQALVLDEFGGHLRDTLLRQAYVEIITPSLMEPLTSTVKLSKSFDLRHINNALRFFHAAFCIISPP